MHALVRETQVKTNTLTFTHAVAPTDVSSAAHWMPAAVSVIRKLNAISRRRVDLFKTREHTREQQQCVMYV